MTEGTPSRTHAEKTSGATGQIIRKATRFNWNDGGHWSHGQSKGNTGGSNGGSSGDGKWSGGDWAGWDSRTSY